MKQTLSESLQLLTTKGLGPAPTYADIDVHPTVFERDGRLIVSAEDGLPWADYYGEFRGGYPWINPVLEAWAEEKGGFWEWENPGCIYFCEN
jgi:hypothetical protein